MAATQDSEKRAVEESSVGGNISAPLTYGTDNGASPPTYNEAMGPPPSYQSIFGEIRGARESSSSTLDFLRKLILLLAGTIGCTIALGLVMAIPIAMIIIGAKYKNDCRIEKMIPIYLIVAGSVGIFKNLISLGKRARKQEGEEEQKKRNPLESVLDCFLFVWFICGNVWIYKNYHPNYDDPDSSDYCNRTLYLFAFWITTSTYIVIGVMCCCICCVGICAAAFGD